MSFLVSHHPLESLPCKLSSAKTVFETALVFRDVSFGRLLHDALMWHDLGTVGLVKEDDYITDLSFDILSLEALFLVPRQASGP